jgi:hypothetical protein
LTADADLGEGVTPIIGELAIDLQPLEAVEVDITPGEPVPQA